MPTFGNKHDASFRCEHKLQPAVIAREVLNGAITCGLKTGVMSHKLTHDILYHMSHTVRFASYIYRYDFIYFL